MRITYHARVRAPAHALSLSRSDTGLSLSLALPRGHATMIKAPMGVVMGAEK